MQETTSTFQTPDGFTIHTSRWSPPNAPKAIVMLIHGIGEHLGRYQHVAKYLVEHGYEVYGLDHRTHGKSSGETRAFFDNFEQPVRDLEIFFDQIKAEHSAKKIFILGHSMGSLITLLFTLKHQAELAGIISSGTPLNVDETVSPMLFRVGKLLQRFVPKMHFGKIAPEILSHDPKVIEAYRTDPLVFQRPARIHMAAEILENGRRVREEVIHLRLPLLVLHGAADELCPPSGSQSLFDRAGSPDKALKFYPKLYHEILNEPERNQVLNDIVEWLNARTSNAN